MSVSAHHATIVEQFTRQAPGFAAAAPIRDAELLDLMAAVSDVRPSDRVLDVACGPGIVTCAFAALAAHAVGVDLVEAMLAQAREHAAELALDNVEFVNGEAEALPWDDAEFDLVVTRFSLHHLERPDAALREMARVCRPGGTVVVCDLAPPARAAQAFNELERLRDPSHVRALTERGLRRLFAGEAALGEPSVKPGALALELEAHLARSFPARAEDIDAIRACFATSIAGDTLGVGARRVGDSIEYAYPLVILAAPRVHGADRG